MNVFLFFRGGLRGILWAIVDGLSFVTYQWAR